MKKIKNKKEPYFLGSLTIFLNGAGLNCPLLLMRLGTVST